MTDVNKCEHMKCKWSINKQGVKNISQERERRRIRDRERKDEERREKR